MPSASSRASESAETDLVTVVVPVFNGRDFLDECVASVVSQSYESLEIILVDDGSTDGSSDLCDAWAGVDPRVQAIHTSNGGLSKARNAGLDAASGAYVTFVDADDVLGPDHVAHMHRVALECSAGLVAVEHTNFTESSSPTFSPGTKVRTLSPDEVLMEVVTRGRGFSSWGKLITASTFRDVRFKDGSDFEDLEIFPRLLARTEFRVALSNAQSYGYRQHERSLMGQHRKMLKKSLVEVLMSNIRVAEDCYGKSTMVANQLTTAYVVHALRVLEQASAGGATRENGYDRRMRQLIAGHLCTVLRSDQLGASYKAGVIIALISPDAFTLGFRGAQRLKRSAVPQLRRRR